MARRYLTEDVGHLAATTKVDRESHLKEDGPVLRHLAAKLVDEIAPATLREWWNREISHGGRTDATGQRYLASISGVLGYAVDLGFIHNNPVDVFRRQISRRRRSKQGRAAEGVHKNPIRDPERLSELIEAAREEGSEVLAAATPVRAAGEPS